MSDRLALSKSQLLFLTILILGFVIAVNVLMDDVDDLKERVSTIEEKDRVQRRRAVHARDHEDES